MHIFLETERLILRRFTADDVDHLYAGFLDGIEPSEWPYHAGDVERCLRAAAGSADGHS